MKNIFPRAFLILLALNFIIISCFEPKTIWDNRNGKLAELKYLVFNCHRPLADDFQLDDYAELRQFYRASEKWALRDWEISRYPQIIVLQVLATFLNASLILASEAAKLNLQNQPEIQRLSSSEFWGPIRTMDNRSFNLTEKIPEGVRLVEADTLGFLFVYCDIPKRDKCSVWDLWIFLSPFDITIWWLLLSSFMMVIALCGNFSETIMPIISATLSAGTKAPSTKPTIFLVWAAACMTLAFLYSGEVAGQLTVPSKGQIMTHFQHLREYDYTLAFPQQLGDMISSVNSFLNRSTSPPGKVVKWLLEKGVVYVPFQTTFHYLVCDPRKLVAFGPWPLTLSIGWKDPSREICPKTKKRKCHVGEELALAGEDFFVFLPPGNSKLTDGLIQLIETGIYQRWREEEHGLLHSRRVQDRVRVKNPTKVIERKPNEAPPQKLKGKMLTLFFLCLVAFVVSIIAFSFEVILSSCGRKTVENYSTW